MADNVLMQGVRGITDLIVKPGLINLDFADIETVMKGMGKAMMGTGEAEGDKRAIMSAEAALANPLIDEYSLKPIRSDGLEVNVAISYGGRREIVDAVKSYLSAEKIQGHDLSAAAQNISADEIAKYLYTAGQPDPELLIRTSGEQRLGGFLLWQSAQSEYYFCEAYWPDFRRVDFLRALRSYATRHRRLGK